MDNPNTTGGTSDSYTRDKNKFSAELSSLSQNLNHKIPLLQDKNIRFEELHGKAMHYKKMGDTSLENHYTILARTEKRDINNMFLGLQNDFNRRFDLAKQAQNLYPKLHFEKFSEIGIYHESIMSISDTLINHPI